VIAVGEHDPLHAQSTDLLQHLARHLHRIHAQVPARKAQQVPVEVISMPLGKPRPGEHAGQDLAHAGRVAWVPGRLKRLARVRLG